MNLRQFFSGFRKICSLKPAVKNVTVLSPSPAPPPKKRKNLNVSATSILQVQKEWKHSFCLLNFRHQLTAINFVKNNADYWKKRIHILEAFYLTLIGRKSFEKINTLFSVIFKFFHQKSFQMQITENN